jgi:hypothetical protein
METVKIMIGFTIALILIGLLNTLLGEMYLV